MLKEIIIIKNLLISSFIQWKRLILYLGAWERCKWDGTEGCGAV